MNPRTTGVLFLVALLLGGLIYFYEIRGGARRDEAEAQAKRFFPELDASAIEWIELRTSDGRDARVERREGSWRLVKPLEFAADPLAADGIADALATLTSAGVIASPGEPTIYGLGDDARWVRFGVAGEEGQEVRVGRPAPIGGSTYLGVTGRDGLFTVETFAIRPLDRSLDALREGRPLRFDRDAIDRIEVSWRGEQVVLEKDGVRWQMREPRQERADDVTVDTLLSDLTFLEAESFLDDADPKSFGFENPDYRVRLRSAGGDEAGVDEAGVDEASVHELVFGGPAEEGETRALRGQAGALYAIDEQRYRDLPRRLVEFRYKQLADFLGSDAASFEVVLRGENADESLALQGEQREGLWMTTPELMRAGTPARMISALSALRAESIIADEMGERERRALRLDPGNAALRVYGAEAAGTPLLAELRLGTIAGGILYAQVPGRDAIYGLDAGVAEDVPVSLEAFRNRFVSAEDEAAEGDSGEAAAPEAPPAS